MKIYSRAGLIGDFTAAIPMLDFLHRKYPDELLMMNDYNRWVADAMDLPILLNQSITEDNCDFRADPHRALQLCFQYHMVLGHFVYNKLPVPILPLAPYPFKGPHPLRTWPASLQHLSEGYIISPFSVSDCNGNKLWPYDRWINLMDKLGRSVYVMGGKDDDYSWVPSGWEIIKGYSCRDVVYLLQKCHRLITIDTGISHLAHLAGVAHHTLLNPVASPPGYVDNRRSTSKLHGAPFDITVDMVYAEILRAERENG